eukprot:TRINITY_DN20537_c0_g1_i2.p1 TRINITY_DN20537_c0_g1~~TRINITY_DN20537_c0_g1_i2.p1  ORF type:complete len:867 (-),score=135.64 TRINITY_DN20537_c0_g1_i2:52-2586(-)
MASKQGTPRKGTGKLPEVAPATSRPTTSSQAPALSSAVSTPRNTGLSSLPKAVQGSASSTSIAQKDYEDSFEEMVSQMNAKIMSPSVSRENLPFETFNDFSHQNKDCSKVTGPIVSSCTTMNTSILELPTTLDPCVQQSVRQSIGEDLRVQDERAQQTLEKILSHHAETTEVSDKHVKLLHQHTEGLSANISDQVRQLAESVTELGGRLEECHRETMSFLREVDNSMRHEKELKHEGFQTEIQEVRNLVQASFAEAIGQAKQATEHSTERLVGELGQLRKSMEGSLRGQTQKVVDDFKLALVEHRKAKKTAENVEHQASQTDPPKTSEVWIQTGDELLKPKKTKKHAKLAARPTTRPTVKENKQKMTGPMFADERQMKEKAKLAMMQKPYNVHDFYHTTGWIQTIARSRWFENLTYAVIAASALWIAIDLDYNSADIFIESPPGFIVAECLFSIFYCTEWVIRFGAFKRKRDTFRDFWFLFDTFLVVLMLAETWGLSILYAMFGVGSTSAIDPSLLQVLRMAKILRLTRMTRLLRVIPEFLIVIRAISAAMRSIFVIGFFCVVTLYVFAVVMRQVVQAGTTDFAEVDISPNMLDFSSVTSGMSTLLYHTLFRDSATLVASFSKVNPILWFVAVVFVLLVSVTLMYMLVGVMVNVISMVASTEREGMTVGFLANTLRDTLATDSQNEVELMVFTKEEFKDLCVNPDVVTLLYTIEVDVYTLIDMADQIYDDIVEKEGRSMIFADFVDIVLSMRGHNLATVKDLRSSIRSMRAWFQEQTDQMLKHIGGEMLAIKEGISSLQEDVSDEEQDNSDNGSDGQSVAGSSVVPTASAGARGMLHHARTYVY